MHVEALIQTFGYPAVTLLVMAESAGIPVPGETVLLLASAAGGATHSLHLTGVIIAGAAGAIAGDTIGYWVGRRRGEPALERITRRLHLRLSLLHRAERAYRRHAGLAVMLGRFVAFLRTFSALLAGVSRMPYPGFAAYEGAGAILWATTISLAGHAFGKNLPLLEKEITWTGGIVLGLLAAGAALYGMLRHRQSASRTPARRTGRTG